MFQIKNNNPNLSSSYALKLANIIVTKSKKYNLDPKLLTAILMQESAYNVSAKNIKCGVSVYTGKKDCVVIDYGIGQINYKTIKAFGFDKYKLLSDIEYSVDASAKVLSDFKRMHGHRERDFWSRYNSSDEAKRDVYKKMVARYF